MNETNYKLERLLDGASIELTPDEIVLLITGINNIIYNLKDTGYGRGDELAAQYRALLEKIRSI